MAKIKEKSRREKYSEALGHDCSRYSVIAFQFRNESEQQQAHYDLMMSGANYALYDGYRTQAYILYLPADEARIKAVLGAYKGKFFEPKLD